MPLTAKLITVSN